MSGFSKPVRDLILARSKGGCEVCFFGQVEQLHHRRARGMGSTRRPESNMAANGLAVCAADHLMIESNRELALDRGWLVRQGHDPAEVPMLRHGADWVLLQENGGVFVPPRGPGRCERCGCHTVTQGHRSGCQVAS